MDYRKGSIKRIFIARIDHDEDLISEISKLAIKENICSAFFIMLGAMGNAEFVTGPKEKSVPPKTIWNKFNDVHEIVGTGNIFWENHKPKIHLHGVAGNNKEITMGCIRKNTKVFMVVEILIIETDIKSERTFDDNMGFSPLNFS